MGNLIVELRGPGSPLIHNVTDMLFLPGNCSRIREASNRKDDYKPDGDAKAWSMAWGPEICPVKPDNQYTILYSRTYRQYWMLRVSDHTTR